MREIELPYVEDFLLELKANGFSEETLYNYERDLKMFKIFLKEEMNIPFEKITKKTILNYKAYLSSRDRKTPEGKRAEKRLSGYSINRMLSAFRSYLKYLVDMDYETPIFPESVKLVSTKTPNPRVAELDEVIELIKAPTHLEKNKRVALRNRALLEVFFSTGVRISELVNIKKDDIDKKGRIFVRGKRKKERFTYLTPRAQKHLENYYQVRGKIESPYLFIPFRGKNASKKNKKLSPSYIQRKIKQYREILGLSLPISAHGLRRAFATYLAEGGASAAAIQRLLGHESLDTTTRYVKISDRHAEEVHRKYHPLKK